jgi:glycosyltransferase involved in cell wall biosynthesis
MEPVEAPPKALASRPVVSAVIPALNEEEPIAAVVRAVAQQPVDEIVVVDNGSTDRTAKRAMAAGARIVNEPRRGYGRACRAGVAAVRPDCSVILFLDGDGSDCPEFVPTLLGPIEAGSHDFVIGSRIRGRRERGSMTPQQVIAARLAGWLCRLVYGVRYTDMAPFRAIRRDCLAGLGMKEQTYGWNLEMQMRAARARLRILEIPVDHRCRVGGVSKVSGSLVRTLQAGFRIAFTFVRIASTRRPISGAAPAAEAAARVTSRDREPSAAGR